MNRYIDTITVNKIFHLKDFHIRMDEDSPHLIITGKNGSGKTILLNAIAEFLCNIEKGNELATDKLALDIPDIKEISRRHNDGKFIFAIYGALRNPKMQEPDTPTKPNIHKRSETNISSTDQFLNFLSDLKIQEALARNENQTTDADKIREWFASFEQLLRELYEDSELHLDFNYKNYSFCIHTEGKSFKFTELSDGFAAAIDIIADLILKMQEGDSVTRIYDKPGIVLIDEIETHLHLTLQKNILKILTRIFPKVQFIVTTHSPFILSSLDNATAFDLEHRETISDLSDYSYESLAEGYFGVATESSHIAFRLEQLRNLIGKKSLSVNEERLKSQLIEEFKSIPEIISPLYIGEFQQLMIKDKARQQ